MDKAIELYIQYSQSYIINVEKLIELIESNDHNVNDETLIDSNFICLRKTKKDKDFNLEKIQNNPSLAIYTDFVNKNKPITFSFKLKHNQDNTSIPIHTSNKDTSTSNKDISNKDTYPEIKLSPSFIKTFSVYKNTSYKSYHINHIRSLNSVLKYVYKYIYDNYLQDKTNKWIIHKDKVLLNFLKDEAKHDDFILTYKNLKDQLIYV